MAMTFTQTDSATGLCGNCTGSIGGRRAASGETVGSTPVSVSVPGSSTGRLEFICIIPSGTSGDSGSWTIRLNVTTANMNLTLSGINTGSGNVVRVNSSCVDQQDIVSTSSAWDNTNIGTTGVKTITVSCSATTVSAGDKVKICIDITNSAMTSQAFSFTPDQNIDSPFTASTAPQPNVNDSVTITESVSMMLNPMLFNVSDTATVTESVKMNMLLFPQPFDTVTVTEHVNMNLVNNIGVFDTVTVTEDARVHILVMPSVFDSVTVAESVTALLTSLNIAANDTVTLTESVALTLVESAANISVSVFDSVTVADSSTVLLPWLALSVSDSITVTEDITVTETGVEPPATGGTSSGGYYRYFSVDEMSSCKREIKTLEKKQKTLEKKIAKLEVKVDDKRDRLAFERNMVTISALIRQLEELERQLEIARRKLAEAEEEEMMLIAFICREYEQRLN